MNNRTSAKKAAHYFLGATFVDFNVFVRATGAGREGSRAVDAETAARVFGNSIRALIFRFVRANPGVMFGEIFDAVAGPAGELTGAPLTRQTFTGHLRILRDAGVLEIDLPEEARRGRSPRYQVDPERASQLVNAFIDSVQRLNDSRD